MHFKPSLGRDGYEAGSLYSIKHLGLHFFPQTFMTRRMPAHKRQWVGSKLEPSEALQSPGIINLSTRLLISILCF